MKVIIAGSRTITDLSIVEDAINASGYLITKIISGGAKGVDKNAEIYAKNNNIPTKIFLPEYNAYPGNVAPLIRNNKMANYGDVLIAIWDGKSTGTRHMISCMEKQGKEVFIYKV